MHKHLKYIDGTSDKFWQIDANGLEYTVTFGKNGTSGVSQTKTFDSPEACLKAAEKLVAEKIKKGYSDDGTVTVTAATNTRQTNVQEILDELDRIYSQKRIDDLLPFFQKNTQGNREVLKKHIRKAQKHWCGFRELEKAQPNGQTWGTLGDALQSKMIHLSAIALFDRSEINSWNDVPELLGKSLDDPHVMGILEWARPAWLDQYLLDRYRRQQWFTFDYRVLRFWEDMHWIPYNPELFALALAFFRDVYVNGIMVYTSAHFYQFVLNDKYAINRDVPQLLEYETQINLTHIRDYAQKDYKVEPFWEKMFRHLISEGQLNRGVFIEKCFAIQTKNWNNNNKAYFRKRLEELQPTTAELIGIQETISTLLNEPLPALVSFALDYLKKCCGDPAFDTAAFLDWLEPVMMRADCKTALKNLLPTLEKISKSQPEYQEKITLLVADMLVIPDMSTQEKVVKLLLKLAPVPSDDLRDKLAMYAPQMMGTTAASLRPLMHEDIDLELEAPLLANDPPEQYTPKEDRRLLTDPVQIPQNWNDLLFQYGNYVASRLPLDGEILLNALITRQHLFPDDYGAQLGPYEKQMSKSLGLMGCTPANILEDFLVQKMKGLNNSKLLQHHHYQQSLRTLNYMEQLIRLTHEKMGSKHKLPLLCFPSHAPYWIAPKVLAGRLLDYQVAGEAIHTLDLAIAICRMPREQVEEALPVLDRLHPEMRDLMAFCLGLNKNIPSFKDNTLTKITRFFSAENDQDEKIALWAVAARTYYPDTFFPELEQTYLKDIPMGSGPFTANISVKALYNSWRDFSTNKIVEQLRGYALTFSFPPPKEIPQSLLYSADLYNKGKKHWEYTLGIDEQVYYWHSIMPQNQDALCWILLKSTCSLASQSAVELRAFLKLTIWPEFRFSAPALLLLSAILFKDKKELRLMASETLLHLVEQQSVSAEQLAEKIAWLVSVQYGIFQRIVECISPIRDVSPMHNRFLLELIEGLFKYLQITDLPANFKKIMELYVVILHKTKSKPSPEALRFLEKWKDTTAIKTLYKQIV